MSVELMNEKLASGYVIINREKVSYYRAHFPTNGCELWRAQCKYVFKFT